MDLIRGLGWFFGIQKQPGSTASPLHAGGTQSEGGQQKPSPAGEIQPDDVEQQVPPASSLSAHQRQMMQQQQSPQFQQQQQQQDQEGRNDDEEERSVATDAGWRRKVGSWVQQQWSGRLLPARSGQQRRGAHLHVAAATAAQEARAAAEATKQHAERSQHEAAQQASAAAADATIAAAMAAVREAGETGRCTREVCEQAQAAATAASARAALPAKPLSPAATASRAAKEAAKAAAYAAGGARAAADSIERASAEADKAFQVIHKRLAQMHSRLSMHGQVAAESAAADAAARAAAIAKQAAKLAAAAADAAQAAAGATTLAQEAAVAPDPTGLRSWLRNDRMRYLIFVMQVVIAVSILIFSIVLLVQTGRAPVYLTIITGILGCFMPNSKLARAADAPAAGGDSDGAADGSGGVEADVAAAQQSDPDIHMTFWRFAVQTFVGVVVMLFCMIQLGRVVGECLDARSEPEKRISLFDRPVTSCSGLNTAEAIYLPIITGIWGYFMPTPGRRK